MSTMNDRSTPPRPQTGRRVRRIATAAALACLAFATGALAQDEKSVLIDGSQWFDFYGEDSTALPQEEGFRPYNIAFERLNSVGGSDNPNYAFELGGVQIESAGQDSWVAGPFTETELQVYLNSTIKWTGRLIDIEKVNQQGILSSSPVYFVVLADNTGSNAKSWTWKIGMTLDEIYTYSDELDLRVIDIEILDFDLYAAIFIANTGADRRDVVFGVEASQEDVAILADWGGDDDYKLVHIGYEGNSTGTGRVSWNYILERTTDIEFSVPVFDVTESQLNSLAAAEGLRISMIDYNRHTGLYAAILVEQLP
ncbi:MAG: hypothetical protein AAGM22_11885 [Acidobacteriota bacterium]